MSHTNSTTNYSLPQFLTTDKPAWLTDINSALSDIDTGMHNAQTKADTAFTDAGNAQADATTAITNAAAADAKASGALASIEVAFDPTTIYSVGAKVIYNSLLYRCVVAVVTPGPWTGSDNWERVNVDTLIATVDSKVGSLPSLNTTDKSSVVNAINEVNGNKSNLLNTANVSGEEITIAANGAGSQDIDISLSGYTPIGIVGIRSSQYLIPYRYHIISTTRCTVNFKNITTSPQSTTPQVYILYVKN